MAKDHFLDLMESAEEYVAGRLALPQLRKRP